MTRLHILALQQKTRQQKWLFVHPSVRPSSSETEWKDAKTSGGLEKEEDEEQTSTILVSFISGSWMQPITGQNVGLFHQWRSSNGYKIDRMQKKDSKRKKNTKIPTQSGFKVGVVTQITKTCIDYFLWSKTPFLCLFSNENSHNVALSFSRQESAACQQVAGRWAVNTTMTI